MCKDNQFFIFILIIAVLFFIYSKDRTSRPLNFDTFFELDSSTPF